MMAAVYRLSTATIIARLLRLEQASAFWTAERGIGLMAGDVRRMGEARRNHRAIHGEAELLRGLLLRERGVM